MQPYRSFLGIDIGKHEFTSHLKDEDKTKTYPNDLEGFKAFTDEHADFLSDGLSVLEPTGGYESGLLNYLLANNFAVHRADARKVKNFRQSPV